MADLPPPLTDAQIQAQVEAQVASEISAATSPLQGQIGGLQQRESDVAAQIDKYFGKLMPFVQGEANSVQQDYARAEAMQGSIFESATKRLNDLANQRAADAQKLAQEMGGPVAVGEFTSPVAPFQATAPFEFAGGLLHGLAEAQSGTQQARAWSGRVFPAMQTEQQAQSRQFYEGQIADLNKQIAQIESQRGGLISGRVADRLIAERQYSLQLAQQELDKQKDIRDAATQRQQLKLQQLDSNRRWRLALAQSKQEKQRINKQYRLQVAQITGYLGGKPTLAERSRLTAEKLATGKAAQAAKVNRQQSQLAIQTLNEKIAHDRALERAATRRGDTAAAAEARKSRQANEARRQTIKENRAPDPGRSRLRGFLVDRLGRPILNKKGHRIKVKLTGKASDAATILAALKGTK